MDLKVMEWTINIPEKKDWIKIFDHQNDGHHSEKLKWNSEDFSPFSGFTFRLEFTCSINEGNIITKVALKNCENRSVFVSEWTPYRPKERLHWVYENFILKPNAGSDPRGPKFRPNTIRYDNVTLFNTSFTSKLKIKVDFLSKSLNDDLERELEREWMKPFSGDTILECEGTELRCHSFILCARSEVLRAFLSSPGFVEGKDRKIKFPNMDLKTLREMLKYLYTDTFDGDFDNIPALFSAADQYDLQGLKNICEDLLIENIDIGNAVEYFYLAYIHDVKKLLESSSNFIRTHFELVKNSEGWKILTDENKELKEMMIEKFLNGLQIL